MTPEHKLGFCDTTASTLGIESPVERRRFWETEVKKGYDLWERKF